MHLTTRRIIIATALGYIACLSRRSREPSAKIGDGRILRLDRASPAVSRGLPEGLQALGYIEGETLTLVIREAEGQEGALPKLAAELVQLQVDVIFAGEMRRFVPPNKRHARFPSSCWSMVIPSAQGSWPA